MRASLQAWFEVQDGPRLRVGPGGLVAGRSAVCDVRLIAPDASRKHALFVLAADGVHLVALGPLAVSVNGVADRTHLLADGDRVELPGLTGVVHVRDGATEQPMWVVRIGEAHLGVPERGLRVGPTGDVTVNGWAGVLRLTPAGQRISAVSDRVIVRNGAVIPAGEQVGCLSGDRLELGEGGPGIEVAQDHDDATVTRPQGSALPTGVRLEMLPRGGRLHVAFGAQGLSVYLHERRFAMVASLLQPPEPLAPGDPVPDETLLRMVWPRKPSKTRVDLNVLLRRLRTDLEGAGIPSRLVVRGRGGGSTRFVLGAGAAVELES